jgi:tetratricopeptide (TPR) repeat protein
MRPPFRLLIVLLVLPAALPVWSASGEKTYQIDGKILLEDGNPPGTASNVFLNGSISPFAAQTTAGRSGEFTIKKLLKGTYSLTVYVPRIGQTSQTIEVGPSVADAKGRVAVFVTIKQQSVAGKEGAISAAELAIPERARKDYDKALECQRQRDINGAIKHLQNAVNRAPNFCDAWNNLGTIAYMTRRYVDAEHYFRECLKHDGKYYASLVNLGGALLSLERFQEALDTNLLAVQMMPGDPLAHSQLGLSYYYLNRWDEAETELKRAKALDPAHFSHPQMVLASIYHSRQDFALMIAELEEFLKLHPDNQAAETIRQKIKEARASLQPGP